MRARTVHRGVTLIELMITITVTLVVLTAAVFAANSQQRSYVTGQRLRGAQGAARRALLALEQKVARAGDILDPAFAFDLAGWTGGTCRSEMNGCPRDSTSNSDELVFFARDPRYWIPDVPSDDPAGTAWRITGPLLAGENRVTVAARAGDVFRNGQIYAAVCPSGAYTFFTGSQTLDPAAADGDVEIPLLPAVATNPFQRQDLGAAETCFGTSRDPNRPARLFLINKYRFHVIPVEIARIGAAVQYDPVLALDSGVDLNGDGDINELDEELIAEGIESMQVAYGFRADTLPLAGTTPGTAIAFSTAAAGATANTIAVTPFQDPPASERTTAYKKASFMNYSLGPPVPAQRLTNAQANIQLVRVVLLARSTDTEVSDLETPNRFLPLLNQDELPAWITDYADHLGGHDGYQRVRLETTISLPAMDNRAITYF